VKKYQADAKAHCMRLSQNEKKTAKPYPRKKKKKKEAAEMSCALRYRKSKFQAARAACNAAMR